MKYFVIGEREIILAFGLVGVQGAVAVNRTEALDAFNRVTGRVSVTAPHGETVIPSDDRPMILILTEDVSVMIEDEVLQWQMSGKYPLIVEIPGIHGKIAGKKSLTDSIREAVGISV